MIRLAVFFLCILVSVGRTYANQEVPQEERNALVDLYNNTKGDQWKVSWDLESPIHTWKGVEVKDNHVVGLTLFMNNLD